MRFIFLQNLFVFFSFSQYVPCLMANGVNNVNTVAMSTPSNRVYFPPIFADSKPPGICVLQITNTFYYTTILVCKDFGKPYIYHYRIYPQ